MTRICVEVNNDEKREGLLDNQLRSKTPSLSDAIVILLPDLIH
jgi:hypothetical protein